MNALFRSLRSRAEFVASLSLIVCAVASAQFPTGGLDLDGSQLGQSLGSGDATINLGSGIQRMSGADGAHRISSLGTDLVPYVSDAPLTDSLYIIGPGDVFQLHVEGFSLERQVGPEGSIMLNRLGAVHLEGLSLKEAKARLLNRLATGYKRTDCFVGLSRPKTMRIFVTGAVNAPGTYDVPGNARLAHAVRVAGGYAASAQKSAIAITVEGKSSSAELQKFYLMGDLGENPYLKQGSLIHVPFIDYSRAWVTVRRDGQSFTVQADDGENLAQLVLKSYSFSPPAPYAAILVREGSGHDTLVAAGEAARYKPMTGAFVEVIPARQEIFVAGAVAAPGLQPHVADRRIIQYVSTAGLLTSSKLPRKIEVIRSDGRRMSMPIQSSALQPGDVLFVRQNAEQKFLLYTPIFLSLASVSLAVITFVINQ